MRLSVHSPEPRYRYYWLLLVFNMRVLSQLSVQSFQKEITLNTERIDGLIVFGEGLIQKSSPQDAALIEDELEELHSYCQEVFSRLVRFHQRLSQPPVSWSTHMRDIHSSIQNLIYAEVNLVSFTDLYFGTFGIPFVPVSICRRANVLS